MPQPRVSDTEKKLRGTFHPSRSEVVAAHGRTRLTDPLPPPSGLDADARREWSLHMQLCITAGTVSASNLRAFQSMVEAAAASAKAYKLAMQSGPVACSKRGSKVHPAWQAWTHADAAYRGWCQQFALTPMSGRMVPQLPVPGGSKPSLVA